jgi:hypothetical protein
MVILLAGVMVALSMVGTPERLVKLQRESEPGAAPGEHRPSSEEALSIRASIFVG